MSLSQSEFLQHLDNQGCFKDENGIFLKGAYYINCINNDICYVEYNERYGSLICCHICYELRIAPPFIFEDDYEIYKLQRTQIYKDKKKEKQIINKK